MKIKLLVFFLLNLLSGVCLGDTNWLCEQASSVKEGSSITSCGVGEANDLEAARRKSRESAIEEFDRLCDLSLDCKGKQVTITPLRTDCKPTNNGFICYRGIKFEIHEENASNSEVNTAAIDAELEKKKLEIELLEKKINSIKELNDAKATALEREEELKRLEVSLTGAEKQAIELEQSRKSQEGFQSKKMMLGFPIYMGLGMSLWQSEIVGFKDGYIQFDSTLDLKVTDNFFVGIGLSAATNDKPKKYETDIPLSDKGGAQIKYTKNSTALTYLASAKYQSGFAGIYCAIEVGRVSLEGENFYATYSNNGSLAKLETISYDVSVNFRALKFGILQESGIERVKLFWDGGIRQYDNYRKNDFITSIGVNFLTAL